MPGRSKHEHHKPAVERLVSEGLNFAAIKKQFPLIPNGTLSRWVNAFEEKLRVIPKGDTEQLPDQLESIPAARVRLAKIDPDSPLDKITRALWDVVDRPDQDGAGVKVQALNSLFKIVQWNHDQSVAQEDELDLTTMDDSKLEELANA